MNINWLESILFGLVSGFAEFLPVSSNAHKTIFLFLFGVDSEHAFLSLFVHIGVLLGLVLSSRTLLKHSHVLRGIFFPQTQEAGIVLLDNSVSDVVRCNRKNAGEGLRHGRFL